MADRAAGWIGTYRVFAPLPKTVKCGTPRRSAMLATFKPTSSDRETSRSSPSRLTCRPHRRVGIVPALYQAWSKCWQRCGYFRMRYEIFWEMKNDLHEVCKGGSAAALAGPLLGSPTCAVVIARARTPTTSARLTVPPHGTSALNSVFRYRGTPVENICRRNGNAAETQRKTTGNRVCT